MSRGKVSPLIYPLLNDARPVAIKDLRFSFKVLLTGGWLDFRICNVTSLCWSLVLFATS